MPQKTNRLYRTAEIIAIRASGEGDGGRVADVSFSSEAPYERFFGMEILSHREGDVQMGFMSSGNAPLLLDHNTGKQIGVVDKAKIGTDRRGLATVRFGKSALADEVFNDVKEGIRRNISVGYRINEMESAAAINGKDAFRVTDWTPLEISVVAVPADISVGVGRTDEDFDPSLVMAVKETTPMPTPAVTSPEIAPAPVVDVAKIRADAIANEQSRVADIMALAVRHNLRDLGDQSSAKGLSLAQFKGVMLDHIAEATPLETPTNELGLGERESREYSIIRAINASATNDWSGAGLERECSEEIATRVGKAAKGFYLPSDAGKSWGGGQRDLTVGTATAGGHLKGTDHLGGAFIDALRDRMIIRALGAQMMSGLRGDIAIPALNAKTTAYWVGENGAPSEGAPTFRQVTMSPKTVGAFVDLSRLLLTQSDPSVEAIVRNDMVNQIAAAIDSVAINGGGTDEPTGILQTTGIGSRDIGTNGGVPTWDTIVHLVEDVDVANAYGTTTSFLGNGKVKSVLSRTARVASTDSKMILDDPWTSIYGENFANTNLVPSSLTKGTGSALSALVFGNFSDLMIGEWGTVDVLVDPYSLSTQGATRVTVFSDVDVAVRHAGSFSASQDLITS